MPFRFLLNIIINKAIVNYCLCIFRVEPLVSYLMSTDPVILKQFLNIRCGTMCINDTAVHLGCELCMTSVQEGFTGFLGKN